jgi:hypothetical protein
VTTSVRLQREGAGRPGETRLGGDGHRVQYLDLAGFDSIECQPDEVGRLCAKSKSVCVPISPGTSATTWVPCGASSIRTPFVRPHCADFAAA